MVEQWYQYLMQQENKKVLIRCMFTVLFTVSYSPVSQQVC